MKSWVILGFKESTGNIFTAFLSAPTGDEAFAAYCKSIKPVNREDAILVGAIPIDEAAKALITLPSDSVCSAEDYPTD
jgi:hypothetical protein